MGEKTILQLCRGRTPSVGSDNLAESTYLKPFYPLLPSLRKLSIPSQTMKISRFVIVKFSNEFCLGVSEYMENVLLRMCVGINFAERLDYMNIASLHVICVWV